MISILPLTRVIGVIAVFYGVCVAAIVAFDWQFGSETTLRSSIGIALSGASGLNFLLLLSIGVQI